jgi:hypothetical protein
VGNKSLKRIRSLRARLRRQYHDDRERDKRREDAPMRFGPCPVVVKHNPIVKESTRQRSASIEARESCDTSDLDGPDYNFWAVWWTTPEEAGARAALLQKVALPLRRKRRVVEEACHD